MKKYYFILAIIVLLFCSWFNPETNPKGRHQAPAVSTYIKEIKGHQYLIVVATNTTEWFTSSRSHCPSISVACIHAESCPCKEKKSNKNDLFD